MEYASSAWKASAKRFSDIHLVPFINAKWHSNLGHKVKANSLSGRIDVVVHINHDLMVT
jgi:hypothetical protein